MKDGGSIILTASSAASNGTEAFSVYAASKAAIRSFARGWTTDLKARKIRVNAISPGVVPTDVSAGIKRPRFRRFCGQRNPAIGQDAVPTLQQFLNLPT
jgi:NAD(P)-dependent dehydrogenase (short-subunit alcohol dehydrogenase family)